MKLRHISISIAILLASTTAFALDFNKQLNDAYENSETMSQVQHDTCSGFMPSLADTFVVQPMEEFVIGADISEFMCSESVQYGAPEVHVENNQLIISYKTENGVSVSIFDYDDVGDLIPVQLDGIKITEKNAAQQFTRKLLNRTSYINHTR